MRLNQVTLPTHDMPASVAFYKALGFQLIVRNDHYARFVLPDGGATLSLHFTLEATHGDAPVVYFECDDLDGDVARLRAAGLVFETDPVDQSWLWREAHLRDPGGNALILYHAGANRTHPPWRLPEDTDTAHYHIVICEDRLLLVKRPDTDWRALQDEFSTYKTSLGGYDIGEAMAFIEGEWPEIFAAKAEAIIAFATSDSTLLEL